MVAAAEKAPPPDFIGPLLHGLLLAWPLALIVLGVAVVKVLYWTWQRARLRRSGILEIDKMNGETFERRLAVLFRALGYATRLTGSAAGDFGCDLLVTKNGRERVVQAKCWKKNVGIKAVQEAHGAIPYYGAHSAIVVTNRYFTKAARELAKTNAVELWGRDELIRALLQTGVPSVNETSVDAEDLPVTVAALPENASCARCGSSVSEKVRDYCLAHPERFGGLIYCYSDQRTFKRRAEA